MQTTKDKSRRRIKKEVITLLEEDWQGHRDELLSYPLKSLLNPLFIALCHPVGKVRRNAICAFAMVIPRLAEKQPEEARIVMRRFLWSLNDESGGIGWGAPEAMAAIMCESEILRKEYLHMLISYMREDGEELFQDGNFLELPMLQRDLLRGIDRLCIRFPQLMKECGVEADLTNYLVSTDSEVAGFALLALFHLGSRVSAEKMQPFFHTDAAVYCTENGEMKRYTIADLAQRLAE